ncbi:hypothetical protein GUJ93_ZPchr0012g20797 [Zizania palustris]|uniref:Uncharacterized protein n=1 Tax=Zizania palustris TaxID=103762 RepID=A0A8J5WIN3_ZIZPA|nr:hypothetical protein GUJ93_ZPchr0012g20797 [Zizania palustris]
MITRGLSRNLPQLLGKKKLQLTAVQGQVAGRPAGCLDAGLRLSASYGRTSWTDRWTETEMRPRDRVAVGSRDVGGWSGTWIVLHYCCCIGCAHALAARYAVRSDCHMGSERTASRRVASCPARAVGLSLARRARARRPTAANAGCMLVGVAAARTADRIHATAQ